MDKATLKPIKTKKPKLDVVQRVSDMDTSQILFGTAPEPQGDFNDYDLPQTSREEYLDKIIKENYSTDNIEVRTDLSSKQIIILSRAKIYANHFNIDLVKEFSNHIMTLSLSKDRKSRGEMVNLSKGHMGGLEPFGFSPEPSISDRLLGR